MTYRVTFPRVVRSEWTKLTALRSTWVVLGVTAVAVVGLAAGVGWGTLRGQRPTVAEVVGGAFLGVDLLSLVLGVFGVLLMTGEYGSGLIRATLAAVPRRTPVLAAKALVLVAAATPVIAVAAVGAFLAAQLFVADGARIGLTDPRVARAIGGAAAAPVVMGLLGLGAGAMLRHTAGAITGFVAAMLVLPALLPAALPETAREDLLPYVPVAATQALYAIDEGGPFPMLAPGTAVLVLAAWVAAALAAGAAVLRRRDA
jgi:ABC-2 type transport system permease protein